MNQTAQQAITDPKVIELLKSIEKFGFRYFGLSENKEPLVTAPNGQIVALSVAYDFVKTKLIEPSQNSNGAESMPVMPTVPEIMPSVPDQGLEKGIEIERQKEKPQQEKTTESDTNVRKIAPKEAVVQPSMVLPFGDGFYPRAFDPGSITQAQRFIASNSGKDDKTSEKWLSVLWQKFIEELAEK